MDITQFLAAPMTPCIYVRVSPDQTIEVDQIVFSMNKKELIEYCINIPGAEQGISWRLLKPYAGGNGMMAKLLVALGDLAGAWTMYPRADQPFLWGKSNLYPMAMPHEVAKKSRVPKPSAGDIETGTKACGCCGRPMGPHDSTKHDLFEAEPDYGMCWECYLEDCAIGDACKLGIKKEAARKKAATPYPPVKPIEPPDDFEDGFDIDAYLSNVNG